MTHTRLHRKNMKQLKPKKCDNPRNCSFLRLKNFKIRALRQPSSAASVVSSKPSWHFVNCSTAFLPALQAEVLPSTGCRILRAKCMAGLFGHLRYSCIWKRAAALLKGSRMGGRCTKPLRPFCCAHHVRCITSKLVRDAPCTEKVRWLIPGGDGR